MSAPFEPVALPFNRRLKLQPSKTPLTADAGALVCRAMMDMLKVIPWLHRRIIDPRDPTSITYGVDELPRSVLLMFSQGWQNLDDADFLRTDPALCAATASETGPGVVTTGLPSQPTVWRLLDLLSDPNHRAVLSGALLAMTLQRLEATAARPSRLVVDVDSLPIAVAGRQPGSAYNGHYHERVYHPLLATLGDTGDLIDFQLRDGQVHTADHVALFLGGLIERLRESPVGRNLLVRMDAGFPSEETLGLLEEAGSAYVARLKNNPALDRLAVPHLGRRPGRPPAEARIWFHDLTYQAQSWSRSRRVVLVVKECLGELVNDHFWLITNLPAEAMDGPALLALYRRRGIAEGYIGEFKAVLDPHLSASPRRPAAARRAAMPEATQKGVAAADAARAFGRNEALLLLYAIADNILNAIRLQAEAATGTGWSLGRLRQQVLRVAARVTRSGGIAVFHIPQAVLDLWRRIWPGVTAILPAPA